MLNHVCQPQTSTDPKICWRCPASKVHFSVGGYSSSSGTWAPADRLPGIRMHLPDARLQTNPTWLPWLEKSCFGCFGPKQNIQNSQGFHIFPASHLALNGKRHQVITSYPPVAGISSCDSFCSWACSLQADDAHGGSAFWRSRGSGRILLEMWERSSQHIRYVNVPSISYDIYIYISYIIILRYIYILILIYVCMHYMCDHCCHFYYVVIDIIKISSRSSSSSSSSSSSKVFLVLFLVLL